MAYSIFTELCNPYHIFQNVFIAPKNNLTLLGHHLHPLQPRTTTNPLPDSMDFPVPNISCK